MTPELRIAWDEGADRELPLPSYQSAEAAGADLRANLPGGVRAEGITMPPGGRALIPTGLRIEIPKGFEVQIRPRSGLALKHGITLANAPGTVDSDYRGPLGVILINLGQEQYTVYHGERIAQMVVSPVMQARLTLVTDLSDTARGAGGFGSTGRS